MQLIAAAYSMQEDELTALYGRPGLQRATFTVKHLPRVYNTQLKSSATYVRRDGRVPQACCLSSSLAVYTMQARRRRYRLAQNSEIPAGLRRLIATVPIA